MATAVRAISFDAGGTLFHPHPSVGEVYAEVAGAHGILTDAEELETRFREGFARQLAHPRTSVDEQAERHWWRAIVDHTFAPWELSAERFDPLFQNLWDTFAEGRRWRLADGAMQALDDLAAMGLPVAICSNSDSRFHQVIADHLLDERFAAVLLSSEVGYEKPAREIFAATAEALGIPLVSLAHVGDRYREDYQGATAAGAHGILLGEDTRAPADRRLPSLQRLAAWLEIRGLAGP